MKKIKFTTAIFLSLVIFLSACNQETTSDGINIPKEKDPKAEEKADLHNKIARDIHSLAKKSIDLVAKAKLFQTEELKEEEKPTTDEIKKLYDEAFNDSEKVRQEITRDFSYQTAIVTDFEQNYLPKLDALLSSLKDLSDAPTDKEITARAETALKDFTTAHNAFIELMNKNIFY